MKGSLNFTNLYKVKINAFSRQHFLMSCATLVEVSLSLISV